MISFLTVSDEVQVCVFTSLCSRFPSSPLRVAPQNMRSVGGCARGAEAAARTSTFESSCVQSLVRACWSRRHIELLTCFLGSTASGSGDNPSAHYGNVTCGNAQRGRREKSR